MKTIGLIGGMSWQSSKLYYELINKKANEILGGSHSAKIIMVSVQYEEIEQLSFQEKWNEIGNIMRKSTGQLQDAGADIVLLCTNTIHNVSHFITDNASIPFLHIADAVGQEIKKSKLEKVGLLGTRFTMEKAFYRNTLVKNHRIETIIPNEGDRQILHDIIYDELVHGKFTDIARSECKRIIISLKDQGAGGVILGCTELPMLLANEKADIPLFDTTKVHAHKAVEWAIE